MRKLLLMLILTIGFGTIAKSQTYTVKNGTNCPIVMERICLTPNCLPPFGVTTYPVINPGGTGTFPACPGGPSATVVHLYFAPVGGVNCSVYDPHVGAPGVNCGYTTNAVIRGSCECGTNNVTYQGNYTWEVN